MLSILVALLAASAVEAVPLVQNDNLVRRQWNNWSASSATATPAVPSVSSASPTPAKSSGSKTITSAPKSATSTATVSSGSVKSSGSRSGSSVTSGGSGSLTEACAVVSASSASYLAAHPSASIAIVDVSDAIDCLDTIPIYKEDATQLLGSLRTYWEFISDTDYGKNPPAGWTNPAYDVLGDLDQIAAKIDADAYASEYDFQVDLYYVIGQGYDGHWNWAGDILKGLFQFSLDPHFAGLVSVSRDGLEDPQIYFAADVFGADEDGNLFVRQYNKSSPVVSLNGHNISEAVEIVGLFDASQAPDTRYNDQFFSISHPTTGFAISPIAPRGAPTYEFKFANGSTSTVNFLAFVVGDFTDVTDGQSAYDKFAFFSDFYEEQEDSVEGQASTIVSTDAMSSTVSSGKVGPTSVTATASMSASVSATSTALPNIPGFPYPIVKDESNLIAGYFLNGTGFEDVAVIQVTGFQPAGVMVDGWDLDFQATLTAFLEVARNYSKTKLVLDFTGNGGGSIDLATDFFVQLFPNIVPDQSGNIRRTDGMDVIIEVASALVAEEIPINYTQADTEANVASPFDYEYNVTPENVNIQSVDQFLDGITFDGTNFTAFFQTNFTDPLTIVPGTFSITPNNLTAKPLFAAKDIIVLTDGVCASSCTVTAERLKNLVGTEFILVGGRPKHGPVQAVGGIKGSQVFDNSVIEMMYQFWEDDLAADARDSLSGTEWDYFNEYAMARTSVAVMAGDVGAALTETAGSVNGRNAFRIGDTTNTPLQFVYDAADCRIWYTPELLLNATALWSRVAQVAFKDRSGLKYTSPYCVAGSTGDPTSISGGWQKGTLGPQDQGLIERASPVFGYAPWAGVFKS